MIMIINFENRKENEKESLRFVFFFLFVFLSSFSVLSHIQVIFQFYE